MSEETERSAIAQIIAVRNNIPRCDTCKWWQPPTEVDMLYDYEAPDYGRCGRIGHPSRVSDRDPALAEDAEGYNAWLRCLPDFGCVLWEPHDTEGTA